jgi:hypothetical protein
MVCLSDIEVITMAKKERSKVGSAPASSTQTGKKGRKITMNREVEIEFEDGLILMMTTDDIFEVWRLTGFPIKFYETNEDESPCVVENWNDWFNLPKQFQDACFEVCVNHVDKNKFVFQAYKE